MIMSRTGGKADVQVTRPGHIFPFGGVGGISPLPQLTQCCRFSIPERLPLRPFRQDHLQRLPLPSSLMASTAKTVSNTGGGVPKEKRGDTFDPIKKIEQLQENIKFIQDGHAVMLHSLHKEINDLTQKNRELQFQLVTGHPALPPDSEEQTEDATPKVDDKIEKLEKEIKKLRGSLKDALKNNATLSNELQALKRERHALLSSGAGSSKPSRDYGGGGGGNSRRGRPPHCPSPEMEEYNETLRQIQRANDKRNSRSSDGQHNDHPGRYWGKGGGGGYMENRRNYNYHHRMVPQPQGDYLQQQQHPRLPRLPLRNQLQNYMHHNQYDVHYQHKPTGSLPSLKQSHGDHMNRHRKSRGPQAAQMADQVYNQ